MGRLRRRLREGERAIERVARLVGPAELEEESAADAEEVEVAGRSFSSASSITSAAAGPRSLATATVRLSETTGEGSRRSSAAW